jgi:hypothetical protein
VGKVKNIRFINILCQSENGVYVSGCDDSRIEDLLFENVRVEINKTTTYRGGLYDRRPCDVPGLIERRSAGFYLNQADDVTLRNCKVVWGPNRPDYFGHAVEAHDVNDLEIDHLKGTAAHPDRDEPIRIVPEADVELGEGYPEFSQE